MEVRAQALQHVAHHWQGLLPGAWDLVQIVEAGPVQNTHYRMMCMVDGQQPWLDSPSSSLLLDVLHYSTALERPDTARAHPPAKLLECKYQDGHCHSSNERLQQDPRARSHSEHTAVWLGSQKLLKL